MSTPRFHTKAAKDGAQRVDGARQASKDAGRLVDTIDQVLADMHATLLHNSKVLW